ncbi:hypothetical protein AEA00_14145 [Xanthomonas campestris pv. campestris]|nr:hypothetical protein AEA00_14145 [Xanthomonas campestris pv. campestris]AKS20962.1 hypothetical protein AEA01_14215 [Xanthomonas campestris pv. campestris]QCX71979.1 hypothetical protein DFG54_15570 [Xanthomonas campestris pv. campestris]
MRRFGAITIRSHLFAQSRIGSDLLVVPALLSTNMRTFIYKKLDRASALILIGSPTTCFRRILFEIFSKGRKRHL